MTNEPKSEEAKKYKPDTFIMSVKIPDERVFDGIDLYLKDMPEEVQSALRSVEALEAKLKMATETLEFYAQHEIGCLTQDNYPCDCPAKKASIALSSLQKDAPFPEDFKCGGCGICEACIAYKAEADKREGKK